MHELTADAAMILDRQVVPRQWTVQPDAAATPAAHAILPLAKWLEYQRTGAPLADVGVLVAASDDPALLRPHLATIPVIAIEFPRFQDGRGYSHARRLRHFWGYGGRLLAVGDVLRDQLVWMWRVGFDAFHLRADQDPAACLRAFTLYTAFYQYGPVSR